MYNDGSNETNRIAYGELPYLPNLSYLFVIFIWHRQHKLYMRVEV